jgi:hypothetical protein
VDCASAEPIQPGAPTTVQLIDPPANLASACPSTTGALTYAFTLAAPQDVRIQSSTIRGSGTPVVGLRDPACAGTTDELACTSGGSVPPLYERALPPGQYVVTVAATSPIDATFEVDLSPPTAAPPDETCAAPPALAANARVSFDLHNHEAAIDDGCGGSGPRAAYDLSLANASDVLLVARLPATDPGSLALDSMTCDAATRLSCDAPSTVARSGTRNVPPGDYRAVIGDTLGLQGSLDAFVRDTVAPTIVAAGAADTCAQALDATAGGFFTGDTSTANADYSNGCDAPGGPAGGAPDQVLVLHLAQAQRVVLDSEGSTYRTILDLRQGPACPGSPVANGCYVGFGPERSFLDMELSPGTYWILVDGYAGEKGPWDLDVRVLPP